MKNKIVIPILMLVSSCVMADFDNFTNWGDVPVATEQTSSLSSEVIASFSGFEAGRKNGVPNSPSDPLANGEFHTLENDSSEVIVSSAVEFPQRLKSKQTIKINLGTKPLTVGATLKFALITEKLKRNEFMTHRFDKAERPISIKFNGNTLYHRNITDGRAEQEVFIPFFMFNKDGNNLEIRNEGNFVLAFDYLKIQLATEGSKAFVAFASDKNMPKPLQSISPIEIIELTLPSETLADVPSLGNASPPLNYEEAFSAMNEFFSLGYARDKKFGENFTNWAVQISKVLKNKKIPYVHIKGDITKVNEKTVMWFLSRYGCIVGGWICDNEPSAGLISKYINGANVVAIDVLDIERVKTAANMDATYTRTYSAPVTVKGGRQDRVYGDFMQQYLAAGENFNPSFLPYLTPFKPLVNRQAVVDNCEDTIVALLQVMMHGGFGALIDAGEAGKNVVLEKKPQSVWQVYRKLFELVDGERIILPMTLSLDTHIEGNPLEDCYYAAVKNSDDEVTVAVFAGRHDLERDVRAIVPVPWSGAATITQQNFYIDEIGQIEPTAKKQIKKNLKVLTPISKKNIDIGHLKGVVACSFKTAGLSIIKIQRYKSKNKVDNISSNDKSSGESLEYAQTYTQLPYNKRYTPIVASTNLTDLVKFTNERISVLGPQGIGVVSANSSLVKKLSCISAPETFDTKGVEFDMRNVPIWDDNSIFIEFSGASRKQRPNYIFNLGHDDYLKGAKGFVFFANAEPIASSVVDRLKLSDKPITFAVGSFSKKLLFDVNIGEPTLVYVPYSEIVGVMKDPSVIFFMMDSKEERDVRLELNHICAVYDNPGNEAKLAVKYELYEKALYLLVEGDTSKPLDVSFRLKDKFKLTKAVPILPHGFNKLKLDMDVERNQYSVAIEKLPNNDGKKGDVSKYFPTIIGEVPSGRTRVLIKFDAER